MGTPKFLRVEQPDGGEIIIRTDTIRFVNSQADGTSVITLENGEDCQCSHSLDILAAALCWDEEDEDECSCGDPECEYSRMDDVDPPDYTNLEPFKALLDTVSGRLRILEATVAKDSKDLTQMAESGSCLQAQVNGVQIAVSALIDRVVALEGMPGALANKLLNERVKESTGENGWVDLATGKLPSGDSK